MIHFLFKKIIWHLPNFIRFPLLQYKINKSNIKIKIASSEAEIRKCQKIRWRVYAKELNIINKDREDAIDVDKYDKNSIHFLAKENKKSIGTVRLILSESKEFRAVTIFGDTILPEEVSSEHIAEISRLCVMPDKRNSLVSLQLIRSCLQFCQDNDINYIIAALDKNLLKAAQKRGIDISPIGPPTTSLGVEVVPLQFKVEHLLNKMTSK